MKDQKERYRQAKEELKRVQEEFRSLRDRLKVRKSCICFFFLRSTGLQRFSQSSLTPLQCNNSEVCLRAPIEIKSVDLLTVFTAYINCSSCKILLGDKVFLRKIPMKFM